MKILTMESNWYIEFQNANKAINEKQWIDWYNFRAQIVEKIMYINGEKNDFFFPLVINIGLTNKATRM